MTEVKTNQQQNIRLLAVKALSDINRNGAYANIKIEDSLLNLCMESFVEKIIWMLLLFTLQNDL